jgi:hypothetical protein
MWDKEPAMRYKVTEYPRAEPSVRTHKGTVGRKQSTSKKKTKKTKK